ncbi:MAG: hypothetical protein ACYDH9_15390 [Limisphaerales bacterium]
MAFTAGRRGFILQAMGTVQLKSPAKSKPLVEAKQAAQAAFQYIQHLFSPSSAFDLSLEEVELSPDGSCWLVTLGFNEPAPKNSNLPEFLRVPIRKLKVLKVDARSGEVLAMKIRTEE